MHLFKQPDQLLLSNTLLHTDTKTLKLRIATWMLSHWNSLLILFICFYRNIKKCGCAATDNRIYRETSVCVCVLGGWWLGCCSLFLIRCCKQQEELNRKVLQASCYLSSKQWYAVTIPPTSPTTHTHKKNTFLHHVTISQHKLDQFKALFMLPVCFQTQTS